MSRILAFSAKKQGGKNTCANFLLGIELASIGVITEQFAITPNGELEVSDLLGDKELKGVFNVNDPDPGLQDFCIHNIYPSIKLYSFADLLKRNVCMQIFGLTWAQCYGSNDQKNSPTNITWKALEFAVGKRYDSRSSMAQRTGPLSAREVMQVVGSDIFRRILPNIWAEATMRQIQHEQPNIAIITDARFPDEVDSVHKAGGKVIRLTRNGDSKDDHASETALDKSNFDWTKFDAVIDNANMHINEQNNALHELLVKWGWLERNGQFIYADKEVNNET